MKEIKFRIIELPTHQVLLTKDFDDEDSTLLIVVTFFLDGMKANLKLGYDSEEKRNEMFSSITEKKAQEFLDSIKEQFED